MDIKLIKQDESNSLKNIVKTRLEVNLEKIPFISFYNYKNKKKIEDSLRNSNKGLEVYSQELPNGLKRSVRLDVSMSYGMPVSEDQDVWTVVSHVISEKYFYQGKCPETIEIDMNYFAKIMNKKVSGKFYENLENSLHRLAGVTLYHEQFMFAKDENNEKMNLECDMKKGIKILNTVSVIKIKKNRKNIKNVVKIEVPIWLRKNYENYYTTYLDIDYYFKLKPGRTRRLYKYLDIYRYSKQYFIDFNRCDSILFLHNIKDRYKRNEKIRLALNELKKEEYIEDYEFENYGIKIIYHKVKKIFEKSLRGKLSENDIETVEFLVGHFNEPDSENMFKNVVRTYRPESIVHCLDLTDETIGLEGIKKTKGSIFMYHLKKYGKKIKNE